MAEWDGGRGVIFPYPLLLCWGEFGVLVGGRSEGDDVVMGFIGFHEG